MPFDGNRLPYVRYLSCIPFAHSFPLAFQSSWWLKLGVIFNYCGFVHILNHCARWAMCQVKDTDALYPCMASMLGFLLKQVASRRVDWELSLDKLLNDQNGRRRAAL